MLIYTMMYTPILYYISHNVHTIHVYTLYVTLHIHYTIHIHYIHSIIYSIWPNQCMKHLSEKKRNVY